jgi:hypothetical protein
MMIEIEPVTNITLAGLYARRQQIRARLMQPQSAAPPMINFRSPAPAQHHSSDPPATAPAIAVPASPSKAPSEDASPRNASPEDVTERVADPPSRPALTTPNIVKVVAAFYDISAHELLSSSRLRRSVQPRQIAQFLAKTLTRRSLPQIGRLIGGRDHTTVLNSIRKIEARRARDPAFAAEIKQLILKLSGDESFDPSKTETAADFPNDSQIEEKLPESG